MRLLIPVYRTDLKDNFAILPEGMKFLEAQIGESEELSRGWFLKMSATIDLNALVHDPKLVGRGVIPADDVIDPASLRLRAFLFRLKDKKKSTYFQAPLPQAAATVFGRSTEQNDDAQFLYGLNFSSSIGQDTKNPDAYYQISLVYDTRSGKISSGSKTTMVAKDVDGELSIIGYLISGYINPAEIRSTAEEIESS